MSETPNPCPWCGCKAHVDGETLLLRYFVTCTRSRCGMGPERSRSRDAVAAWNRVAKPRKHKEPK